MSSIQATACVSAAPVGVIGAVGPFPQELLADPETIQAERHAQDLILNGLPETVPLCGLLKALVALHVTLCDAHDIDAAAAYCQIVDTVFRDPATAGGQRAASLRLLRKRIARVEAAALRGIDLGRSASWPAEPIVVPGGPAHRLRRHDWSTANRWAKNNRGTGVERIEWATWPVSLGNDPGQPPTLLVWTRERGAWAYFVRAPNDEHRAWRVWFADHEDGQEAMGVFATLADALNSIRPLPVLAQ